jgi:chromosomal replication initiation ATPase DnaA
MITVQVNKEVQPMLSDIIKEAEAKLSKIANTSVRLTMHIEVSDFQQRHVDKALLQELVCEAFDVEWFDLTTKNKKTDITEARQVYSYLCDDLLKLSSSDIAKDLCVDRSSISVHIKNVKAKLEVRDERICKKVNKIFLRIKIINRQL